MATAGGWAKRTKRLTEFCALADIVIKWTIAVGDDASREPVVRGALGRYSAKA